MPLPRREDVIAVLSGPVENEGYDLEDVQVTAAGTKSVLRVVVDSDSPLTLDDVVELTGVVSDVLDAEGAVDASPYTLEVTSRGVDSPLTAARHWRRSRGRKVRARIDGTELTARIGALGYSGGVAVVGLIVPGRNGPSVREVPLADIEQAVVQVEFSAPDPRETALVGVPEGSIVPAGMDSEAEDRRPRGRGWRDEAAGTRRQEQEEKDK